MINPHFIDIFSEHEYNDTLAVYVDSQYKTLGEKTSTNKNAVNNQQQEEKEKEDKLE